MKDLNAILGKETIDMYNTGQSKGSQESYNMNYQKLGKDLMTMDELAVMDGSKCIVAGPREHMLRNKRQGE